MHRVISKTAWEMIRDLTVAWIQTNNNQVLTPDYVATSFKTIADGVMNYLEPDQEPDQQ